MAGDAAGDFEVSAATVAASRVDACFRDPLGQAHQVSWLEAAQDVVFEDCPVMRSFPVRYGRRVAPGWWWSSTRGRLVAYGSGAMRTQLMLLDRDPAVVALACRPVELVWRENGGRVVGHAPQLMARLKNGSGLLVDCVGRSGPSARLAGRARIVTAAAEAAGWCYQFAEPPDPVLVANVRWLAGYRHPRHGAGPWRPRLMAAFGSPRPAVEAVRELGDPIAVWPAVFHALWSGVLSVRLDEPLHERVIVSAARQEAEEA
ncbi:TnsA-like heteromeric transposase endonuclease subunit [Streptomyces mirabilis]|uniref:TnsA-like heteromeric transposase endonuclease subunit n=1 Tax=Streptomyces mirabilis TaxID=68239 RepID=UPI00368ACF22